MSTTQLSSTDRVIIEKDVPRRLSEADLVPRRLSKANLEPNQRAVHPSPCDWRDQVLYFLLPDRFANGQEVRGPVYDRSRPDQFKARDRCAWMKSGKTWQGGTLQGIIGELDYLQNLGVTTLWIGPVWRQRKNDQNSYHGYGIQNFLDVDPRFGSRQDLRDLVDAAHARRMYVILDIILNHTGNNWFYKNPATGGPWEEGTVPYLVGSRHEFHSWRSADDKPTDVCAWPDDGVWPIELQNPELYHMAGEINRWDPVKNESLIDPALPFRRGDFIGALKDLDHEHSPALSYMIKIYQYWIALSDCDGFRIDTVKHMSHEASHEFCGAIREYAETIGKQNFWLLGEVAGDDRMRVDYLDVFGQNLSAVLDIGNARVRLAEMVSPGDEPGAGTRFFKQFGSSPDEPLGGYREVGRYHVSILDDHDMVWKGLGSKERFAAVIPAAGRDQRVAHAVGVQLTTLGVPCIYYGTEQAFDGSSERDGDPKLSPDYADRYIREAMFGATFGAFGTSGCHFFDETHPTYRRIAAIARLRAQKDAVGLALRHGRQLQRRTIMPNDNGPLPAGPGEVVAWSRIMHTQEVLVVLNTYAADVCRVAVQVDASRCEGSTMTYLYRGDWSDQEVASPPANRTAVVTCHPDCQPVIHIDLPAGGMAILA